MAIGLYLVLQLRRILVNDIDNAQVPRNVGSQLL